jgi:hypothetical protein
MVSCARRADSGAGAAEGLAADHAYIGGKRTPGGQPLDEIELGHDDPVHSPLATNDIKEQVAVSAAHRR